MLIGFNRKVIAPCNDSMECQRAINDTPAPTADINKQADSIKEKTGVVANHLISLQRTASELNCIIAIRPVDRLATELIEAGYPTKGFHIKGKSASWGLQAGFICVNQRLSKLEGAPDDLIDKFNGQVQQCLQAREAVAVPLVVSESRLRTLLHRGCIAHLADKNSDERYRFQSTGPSGRVYEFDTRKLSTAGEPHYLVLLEDKPIELLAPKVGALPFTADYDLLLIAPHISDLGPQDNLPIPDVAHEVFRRRIENYSRFPCNPELTLSHESREYFYRDEDKEIGNASLRVRQMIALINDALVGDGEKVVHHNVDSASPTSEESANYPATFALPVRIGGFDELCIIASGEEMKELVAEAKRAGYLVKMNPLWEPALIQVRNPRFEDARQRLLLKR